MPLSYKPRRLDLDPCPSRSLRELEEAAALLGNALVLACDLSCELKLLNINPSLSSSAPGQARQAFGLLKGMLVAERWLIEFLMGPLLQSSKDPDTQNPRKREGDICVDCFLHDWRLSPGELANELVRRKNPINKLAAHPPGRISSPHRGNGP